MAERTVSVKLRMDVAQYMASARGAVGANKGLEKAARDVRRALDEEEAAAGRVKVAQARLNEVQADGKAKASQLAAAQEQLASANRSQAVAADNSADATARFTKAQEDAENAGKRRNRDSENETSRMAARTNAQFDALKFTGLSAGLPAAAAIGVAGAGLLLAAVPIMFAAIGFAAVSNTEKVASASSTLTATVAQDTQAMAAGLAGPVADAMNGLGETFVKLEPQIQKAFNGSAPAIRILEDAVSEFAFGAMPGMVKAIDSSRGPLLGIKSLAGQVGDGFTDLFTNVSAGSESAGHGMSTLGGITQDLLGFIGTLLAQLANGSAGPLSSFQAMLRSVESAVLALTASGSGAIGFLTGFTNAGTGLLSVLALVSQLLSAMPAGVTQFAGSLTAASMLLSKFGVNAGAGFEGLSQKIKDADGATNKLKTGVSGLLAGAFNPAMLATAALGFGLQLLGQKQAEAAAQAQNHRERVNALATALRESNGAINSNVRATANSDLANFKVHDGYRNLIGDARTLGVALPTLTDAYLGNATAQKSVVTQLEGIVAGHKKEGDSWALMRAPMDDHIRVLDGMAYQYDDTGLAAQELLDNINGAGSTFSDAAKKNADLAAANEITRSTTTELSAAIEVLSGTAGSAEAKITALKTALDILHGRTPTFEEGIQAGNDQLRGFTEAMAEGVKKTEGFGKALLNADGTVNTFSKNGSGLQDLATGLQTSFVNAASGIDEMVRRGVPFADATKRVNDSLGEQRNRFIGVAEKMGLSSKEAAALADKYGLIPKDVSTLVTANTKFAKEAIDALPPYASGVRGAVVMSANTDPATGMINATVQYADNSTGVITISGNKDPATGKVMTAVQFANGQTGTMTVEAAIQAAKEGTLTAVRFANGQTGFIQVAANAVNANNAIDNAARTRYTTIQVSTVVTGVGAAGGPIYRGPHAATGGLFANGDVQRFAKGGQAFATSGGLTLYDLIRGGLARGPGTGTSDELLARVSNGEFVNNARSTRKNLDALKYANAGGRIMPVPRYSEGGVVSAARDMLSQLNSGGQFFEDFSFYGNSALVAKHNTEIEEAFGKTRSPGWDFDPSPAGAERTRSDISSWLQGFINQKTAEAQQQAAPVNAVHQAITSGNAVRSSSAWGGSNGGSQVVRLELGRGSGPFEQAIMRWLRNSIRDKGGNVQVVLGAGS